MLTFYVIHNKQLLLSYWSDPNHTPYLHRGWQSTHSPQVSTKIGNKSIKAIFRPLTPDDIMSIDFLCWIWIALIKMYIHIKFHYKLSRAVLEIYAKMSLKHIVAKWPPYEAILYYVITSYCIIILRHGPNYTPSGVALSITCGSLVITAPFCCKNNNNKKKKTN